MVGGRYQPFSKLTFVFGHVSTSWGVSEHQAEPFQCEGFIHSTPCQDGAQAFSQTVAAFTPIAQGAAQGARAVQEKLADGLWAMAPRWLA